MTDREGTRVPIGVVRRVAYARVWKRWEWEFYHSGYGLAFGRRWSKRGANRAYDRAVSEFFRGVRQ